MERFIKDMFGRIIHVGDRVAYASGSKGGSAHINIQTVVGFKQGMYNWVVLGDDNAKSEVPDMYANYCKKKISCGVMVVGSEGLKI